MLHQPIPDPYEVFHREDTEKRIERIDDAVNTKIRNEFATGAKVVTITAADINGTPDELRALATRWAGIGWPTRFDEGAGVCEIHKPADAGDMKRRVTWRDGGEDTPRREPTRFRSDDTKSSDPLAGYDPDRSLAKD